MGNVTLEEQQIIRPIRITWISTSLLLPVLLEGRGPFGRMVSEREIVLYSSGLRNYAFFLRNNRP